MTPVDMQPMSLWQLLLNNPEWVAVFASSLFSLVTVIVIIWQVCVMTWQGRTSARHERIQNKLIRLQREHEWVWQRNRERGQLLESARKLNLAVGILVSEQSSSFEPISWGEIQDASHELSARLRILDVAVFTGFYDQWFSKLEDYVDAIQHVVIEESNVQCPSSETKDKLKEVQGTYNPIGIFLEIEAAIRMEFFEFKKKWDALLHEPT
jgi:hypothetical protein